MLNRRSFVGCLAGLPLFGRLVPKPDPLITECDNALKECFKFVEKSNRRIAKIMNDILSSTRKLTEEEFLELRQTPRGKAYPPIMDIPVERWPI